MSTKVNSAFCILGGKMSDIPGILLITHLKLNSKLVRYSELAALSYIIDIIFCIKK